MLLAWASSATDMSFARAILHAVSPERTVYSPAAPGAPGVPPAGVSAAAEGPARGVPPPEGAPPVGGIATEPLAEVGAAPIGESGGVPPAAGEADGAGVCPGRGTFNC